MRSVIDAFDEHVAGRPEATAVVDDKAVFTYSDLDQESRGYATLLRASGAGPETVVAVVAERTPQYVAMVLGVLRTGAAFLPIEPTTPAARTRQMGRTAAVRLVLAQPEHQQHAAGLGVVVPAVRQVPGHLPPAPRSAAGLAYIIFTSGSTGQPKGAMVTDGGMVNHIAAKVTDLDLTEADVVGFTAPLSFDISVWQALAPLTVGARVAVASPINIAEPAELVDWTDRHRVTVLEIVPSFLAVLLDELDHDPALRRGLRSLRWLMATGEALPGPLVRRWYQHFPGIPVINAYGPTECSDDVTHHVVSPADVVAGTPPPVGREILNTTVYVVDATGGEAAAGAEGDLLVGGRGVGRGYVGDPVRTALAFVPDHLSGTSGARLYRTGDRGVRRGDGVLSYLGRFDRQVKVRGHRVELGDVESELVAVPGVTASACVFQAGRLEAFVTTNTGLTGDRVLQLLRRSAPHYLVPNAVRVLDRLPTGASGKVDHRALHGLIGAREPAGSPPGLIEALFAEILTVPVVGADDDFFAAGGDSLKAMSLVSAARRRFDVRDLPLRSFLADPTPRGLLAAIEAARADTAPAAPDLTPGRLSSGQERLWFMEQLFPRHGAQLIRLILVLRGQLDQPALEYALNAVVARHEPLRTVFTVSKGVPVGKVWPQAAVTLLHAGTQADADAALADGLGLSASAERPPLLTARLLTVAADEHRLTLVLHHMVADGWSLAVLGREIATYYRKWLDDDRGIELPESSYGAYVGAESAWLGGADAASCEQYWTDRLDRAPAAIDLPFDRPPPARRDFTATSVTRELSPADTAAVSRIARSHRATPFMVVVAAFHAVLGRLTGADDLVIGIDSVNRSWPGSEELIGTFVNQLPLRITVPASSTFGEVVTEVRAQCIGGYANDRLPFHKIVAAVNPPRHTGRFPLFQVKVTHQSGWRVPIEVPGLVIEPVEISEPVTDLDLMLDVSGEADRLRLELVYRPEVLDHGTATAWVTAIGAVLRGGGADPGRHPGTMISTALEAAMADGDPDRPAPRTPTEGLVAEVWRELLEVDEVGPDDDFFAVGGHSLVAVQVVHELSQRTGVALDLETFFDLSTVEDVAAELDRLASSGEHDGIQEGEL